MLKLKMFLLLLIISATGIDGRARRKRRGIWPDVLAPGGNTFAASGYYGMQSYIAYPESGIAFNSYGQGWNPYGPGYYQQNQFNNYNPYGYNQPYPYGTNQGMLYGGLGMSSGLPYTGQGNFNGYYPSGANNLWYPPSSNFGGPLRSGVVNSRTGGNIGGPSRVKRTNRPLSPPSNPTNK